MLLFADGRTVDETAGMLARSPGWVKARRSELIRRAGAKTLAQALMIYGMEGAFTHGS